MTASALLDRSQIHQLRAHANREHLEHLVQSQSRPDFCAFHSETMHSLWLSVKSANPWITAYCVSVYTIRVALLRYVEQQIN